MAPSTTNARRILLESHRPFRSASHSDIVGAHHGARTSFAIGSREQRQHEVKLEGPNVTRGPCFAPKCLEGERLTLETQATLTLETHVQGLAQELQDLICDFVFTADSAEIVVIRKASQPLNSMLAVNRAFRTPFDPFLLLKPVCPTKAPTGSRIDSASLLNSPWIAERCIGAAGGV